MAKYCPNWREDIKEKCGKELHVYRKTFPEQRAAHGLPLYIYGCGVCGWRGMLTSDDREFKINGRRFNEKKITEEPETPEA